MHGKIDAGNLEKRIFPRIDPESFLSNLSTSKNTKYNALGVVCMSSHLILVHPWCEALSSLPPPPAGQRRDLDTPPGIRNSYQVLMNPTLFYRQF